MSDGTGQLKGSNKSEQEPTAPGNGSGRGSGVGKDVTTGEAEPPEPDSGPKWYERFILVVGVAIMGTLVIAVRVAGEPGETWYGVIYGGFLHMIAVGLGTAALVQVAMAAMAPAGAARRASMYGAMFFALAVVAGSLLLAYQCYDNESQKRDFDAGITTHEPPPDYEVAYSAYICLAGAIVAVLGSSVLLSGRSRK